MRIGNGQEKPNSTNIIEIPDTLTIPFTTERESLEKLFTVTYPNMHTFFSASSYPSSRVILTTKNDFVNEMNDMLIDRFQGTLKTFVGIDETNEPNDQAQFEDLLHTFNPAGLPPHKLSLKENCPIILLRNLNSCEGFCNQRRI
ncbi:uncharacterized protein LOC142165931 [Nicotiana tabacum]|uniref:Uncharacterized protein LOC142165931 n=1 Tax=Nicotiana tabacum TaxID=4097 RepID=A0AC58S608_TOBAC